MCEKCYHVRFPVDRKSYPRPLFIRGRWFWRRSEMLIKSVTRAPTKQVLFLILGVYIEVGGGGGGGSKRGSPGPPFYPPKTLPPGIQPEPVPDLETGSWTLPNLVCG